MAKRPLRSFLAILMVAGSGLPGLVGSSASAAPIEPVVPTGGCWRYTPGPGPEIDDATGIIDRSLVLEPWAVDPQFTFGTAGDTVVQGVRTFGLAITGGPAVLPQLIEHEGSATFLFDVLDPVGGRTELDPIVVDFEVPAGTATIPAMQAEGAFQLAQVGTSVLILRGVYFDLPGLGERLACNGQLMGDAVTNPATTPQDTSVVTSATSVPATTLAVARVVDQLVVDAARPGDVVEVALSGFASESQIALGFCGPSTSGAPTCGPTASVTTLVYGSAAATLTVPADAAIGTGGVRAMARIGSGDVVRDQPLRVLGKPELELRETSGRNSLRVVGAQWDPLRPVRITAVDEDGDRVGKTVSVHAGQIGEVDARLTIPADTEVAAVVAQQQRAGALLEATVDVPADDTGGGADDDSGGSTGDTSDGSTDGSASSAPVSAPAVAPLDIPAPVDLPVTTVADPQAAAVATADALAVTEVRLAGSTRVPDLFGGGPDRVLKLRVENVGSADVIAPGLSIAVGKGKDADPIYASDGFGRLAPGESTDIEIPISLPSGAFGVYTITGQIGDGESGEFSITWETYPWGLFALNALGVLLIAFAVRRRVFAPKHSRVAALIGAPRGAAAARGEGAAVIDLAVLERWWALQADDTAREAIGVDAVADAVVDVDAVERWLERCSERNAELERKSASSTSSNN